MATYSHETTNVWCIGCGSLMVMTYRSGVPYRLGCPVTTCTRATIDLIALMRPTCPHGQTGPHSFEHTEGLMTGPLATLHCDGPITDEAEHG